jgi:hypothetical protein
VGDRSRACRSALAAAIQRIENDDIINPYYKRSMKLFQDNDGFDSIEEDFSREKTRFPWIWLLFALFILVLYTAIQIFKP